MFGYSYTLPAVEGRATAGGIRIDPSFFALFLALTIYTASHIAEIVRGSIQAVPRGQGEAADAVALSGFQRMWYIILPQAMRIGIPPIGFFEVPRLTLARHEPARLCSRHNNR